jgi:hypothetical protein
METNKLDDLHSSVNDIYSQWDSGKIEYADAIEILNRVCTHFIGLDAKNGLKK